MTMCGSPKLTLQRKIVRSSNDRLCTQAVDPLERELLADEPCFERFLDLGRARFAAAATADEKDKRRGDGRRTPHGVMTIFVASRLSKRR